MNAQPLLIFAKSYVKAHKRKGKDGKIVEVAAHFDKRIKKGSEHAQDHGHDTSHLSDADKAKFNQMHREQHLLHHYHRHKLDKKVKEHAAKKAGYEALANASDLQGDTVKAEQYRQHAKTAHAKLERHQAKLKDVDAAINGIAKMKEAMVAGSGKLEASNDSSHAAYKSKLEPEQAKQQAKAKTTGKTGEVEVLDEDVPTRWQLVDVKDLTATIEKADNQWRDRTRAGSKQQVSSMANKLKFKLLADSPVMDYGAPTLAKDGKTIIGGNGRVLAVGEAYGNGKASQYKADLAAQAAKFGFKKADVEAMGNPILIRVLQKDVDVKKAAIASNEGGGLKMSALEQAKVDAERMGELANFAADDSGNINIPANKPFINKFVLSFPVNQQAAFQSKDGYLSQEGTIRLRNAVLYRAYGDSEALSRMAEETDPGQKNLLAALVKSAPLVAKAKAEAKAGNLHDLDISADIVMAAHTLNTIKTEGKFKSAQDYLKQLNVFDDPLSQEAKTLLTFFDGHIKSSKAIAYHLMSYYDKIQQLGSPKQAGLFGDMPVPSKSTLLTQTAHESEKNGNAEDLFGKSIPAGNGWRRTVADILTPSQKNERRPAHQAGVHGSHGGNQGQEKRLILFFPKP